MIPRDQRLPADAPWRPVGFGWRDPDGSWSTVIEEAWPPGLQLEMTIDGDAICLVVTKPGAAAIEIAFAAPPRFQAFGGGERFESLDLRGQSVRYYLENAGLGSGVYLPSPWIATTLGFGLFLPDEAPATFHIAPHFDPNRIRVQAEGDRLEIEIHRGDLAQQYAMLIARIGPPLMPDESFFSLWKAGDWRYESAATVQADIDGFARLGLPLGVKLIDAYWEDEVHSFAFDQAKYPDAWGMVARLAEAGAQTWLWLCPWVVVGTKSFEFASAHGYTIVDASGQLITRRPGANPNIVAALIDFSNPQAAEWWTTRLRGLLKRGIAGFKADFGEQLPEHALLHSGETGGRAHNAFVRYYIEATIAAFDGATPAIISRSGSPRLRTPIWSGDQTSDFCPKSGLQAAVRAAQSGALSGWSFNGSDLGGYFGTPTPQVFARWTQFACFTPLMMLHGLGCREPWDMDEASATIYAGYARLHLALLPMFQHYGEVAAAGGLPLIRMMPLAFPQVDWSGINDWDQQFMLGDDILVAPAAFYGDIRAVWLPDGEWYDALAGIFVTGSTWRVHHTPLDRMPVFIRKGAVLTLATDSASRQAIQITFGVAGSPVSVEGWTITSVHEVGEDGSLSGPVSADLARLLPLLGLRAI